jgi:type IV secretory pathway VirD2 relaxase
VAWSAGWDRYVLHGEELQQSVIGRVIGKRLTDELGDRAALIVDGVDGRTHHVALGDKVVAEDAPMGSIVEIARASAGQSPKPATSDGPNISY